MKTSADESRTLASQERYLPQEVFSPTPFFQHLQGLLRMFPFMPQQINTSQRQSCLAFWTKIAVFRLWHTFIPFGSS